jgi:protein TilB
MTLNFIDIEDLAESMTNLSKVPKIKELYLTGNPCESWPGFRDYVIARVQTLTVLDGNEILKSDRLKAFQKLSILEKELVEASYENVIKKQNDPDKDDPNKYTPEYRKKLYKELEEEKIQKEEAKKQASKPWGVEDLPKEPPSVYKDNGEIRVCNQGRYEFIIDQDFLYSGITTFELKLPKYMDTSQIDVDLNPQYVRVNAKGKITQIKFDYEIVSDGASIQRSTTTGHLLIKAQIVGVVPRERPKNKNPKYEKKNLKKFDDNLMVSNKIEHVKNIDSLLFKEAPKKETFEIDFDLSEVPDLD